MRIAVLGGAGFIGSNFVRYIMKNHDEVQVLVYDKLTYAGRLENLHDVINDRRLSFIKGDICNEELLEHSLREFNPDVVINFAAETHVDRSINDPFPFLRTNVFGVFTLLEVARRLDINRLVHISTDEVYGDLFEINDEADETWPLNPSSPYSASKASGDLFIKAYGRTYGIKYVIARPSNNYGPYQHPEKLIPRTIIRLLHGKQATIYGDGSQIRDWLYVEDTCKALDTIMTRGSNNEVYNLCAHEYASVKDVVLMLVRLMNKDTAKDVVYVRGRPGEDRRYAMKCNKIVSLGWKALVSLEDGLKKTIDWYLANDWWWRPLLDEVYILADAPWKL
ncbi:MAG: dTDP-glucose 4,6-dehydratase [Fervidicoccaceae archaeon]